MNNINKKEICIKNMEEELKNYKRNKKRFEIKDYTIHFMEFVIDYVKQNDGNADVFDDLIEVPNLLLNLTYNICNIDEVDDVLYDSIRTFCNRNRLLKGYEYDEFEDEEDDDWDDDDEEDEEETSTKEKTYNSPKEELIDKIWDWFADYEAGEEEIEIMTIIENHIQNCYDDNDELIKALLKLDKPLETLYHVLISKVNIDEFLEKLFREHFLNKTDLHKVEIICDENDDVLEVEEEEEKVHDNEDC